jgi:hypothetical protein
MGLLDPRFRYVPAVQTDVIATWRRFGFDARQNEERRARLKRAVAATVTAVIELQSGRKTQSGR